ncbi:hypothetical protein OROGR_023735 [Orobanche gracilis]
MGNNIGTVIGKGGSIVKSLREETQAKIIVSNSVPGSDVRVITIFSPSEKHARRRSRSHDEKAKKEYEAMKPHCAAQDALFKVHNRIVEEDLRDAEKAQRDETVVSACLLVSDNTVGCLLGRKGDVIQRLRSETGANIRVVPSDHLTACSMRDDELVKVNLLSVFAIYGYLWDQNHGLNGKTIHLTISGKPAIVKKALFEVSTLLYQNPQKDKPPLHFPPPYASHHSPYTSEGFHLPGPQMRNMLPPKDSTWLDQNADAHRMQPMPFRRGYGNPTSVYEADDFNGGTPPRDWETPTGIHVLWDQRSQTIDAILHLQNKNCEYSEDGTITTKLLVASNRVGCLLGQGGNVMNDMRRRTHADIRVFSKKEEKPKCALEDEELVQVLSS